MGVGTHQHEKKSCEKKMVDTNNKWIMSMCSTATIQFMNKIFMDD